MKSDESDAETREPSTPGALQLDRRVRPPTTRSAANRARAKAERERVIRVLLEGFSPDEDPRVYRSDANPSTRAVLTASVAHGFERIEFGEEDVSAVIAELKLSGRTILPHRQIGE